MQNKSEYTKRQIEQIGAELIEWVRKDEKNNWYLKSFFSDKNIPYSYVDGFCRKSTKFKNTFNLCKDIMESRLVKNLTSKGYATSGIISILKNQLGWEDKTQIEQRTQIDITPKLLEGLKEKYFKK